MDRAARRVSMAPAPEGRPRNWGYDEDLIGMALPSKPWRKTPGLRGLKNAINREIRVWHPEIGTLAWIEVMAENTPDSTPGIPAAPGPIVPPKPPEAAKVQPKKETVRINLPPKPTASPTIKLPAPHAASSSAAASTQTPAPPQPPANAPAAHGATRAAVAAPAAPTNTRSAAPVASSSSAKAGVGTVDYILSITAALAALAALVSVFMLTGKFN